MEKYLTRSTFEILEEKEEQKEQDVGGFVLGVLGCSNAKFWTSQTIQDSIAEPLTGEQGAFPTQVLLPADGTTSLLLQVWAERNSIPTTPITAEWKTLGRRARAMRDTRIMKESTHLLFFLGGRSDYYEKMAIREAKKGKIVYTVDGKTHELVQWILDK